MAFAATPPYNGTLAKYYRLPEDLCYKLPDSLSLEQGALVEPLGVAVHLVRQANVSPGASVVIFGAGPVGLLCRAVSNAFGAAKVVAVDIQRNRLEFAREFTTTSNFLPLVDVSVFNNAARLGVENELGNGAYVVIDASGAEASIKTGIHVLRPGGTYVQGGMGHDEGGFRYATGDYKLAIELVASQKVNSLDLVTDIVKFEDTQRAFQQVKDGNGIKFLIAGVED
ncbi:uncharacterized protein ASPGLDRAFT_71426 [Aspergillus glaucus CBS 516.65]|uniref:Alcohol dehydrogenase-like C-terminal domain-containing protein n=1 Tax=Aspergillus glaucus CBS 516.65 TaxID=1160497 RepID=A0A1L9VWT2_ASPGL|nr:hypothetical protein ASPGLDRAFT_71426 [Aspergillus glaucus CBS 516.65]OJJ88359.1 hypothetical protein ASPGLDRAFT_71426 [Aspergillus glaucus CBS 516.65]